MSDIPPISAGGSPTLKIEGGGTPPKAAASDSKSKAKTEANLIIASLEKSYTLAGTIVAMASPQDGQVIAANARNLAESWRALLESNNRVRSQMRKMIESSGWSSVIFAHLMVAYPIVMNHKDKFAYLTNKGNRGVPNRRVATTPTTPTN